MALGILEIYCIFEPTNLLPLQNEDFNPDSGE